MRQRSVWTEPEYIEFDRPLARKEARRVDRYLARKYRRPLRREFRKALADRLVWWAFRLDPERFAK